MPIGDKDIGRAGLSANKISGLLNPNPWTVTRYVSSTHTRASDNANTTGRDKNHPLATIARAATLSAAGDMIIVAPAHVETISAAGGITVSVADVTILGLGAGDRKPKITFSTAVAGSFLISGAGVHVENLHFVTNVTSLVLMLSITGTDAEIIDCKISETGSGTCLDAITASATSDRLKVIGLKANLATAGSQSCIQFQGDDTIIADCDLHGGFQAGAIENVTTAVEDMLITRNHIRTLHADDVCIAVVATSYGWITHNNMRLLTDTIKTWIVAAVAALSENYGVNDDGETGLLEGTASA